MSPDSHIPTDQFDNGEPCVLVTESGTASSKVIGFVFKPDWVCLSDKETKLIDYMHKNASDSKVSVHWSYELEQIDAYLKKSMIL